jgi:hypothetical protein
METILIEHRVPRFKTYKVVKTSKILMRCHLWMNNAMSTDSRLRDQNQGITWREEMRSPLKLRNVKKCKPTRSFHARLYHLSVTKVTVSLALLFLDTFCVQNSKRKLVFLRYIPSDH